VNRELRNERSGARMTILHGASDEVDSCTRESCQQHSLARRPRRVCVVEDEDLLILLHGGFACSYVASARDVAVSVRWVGVNDGWDRSTGIRARHRTRACGQDFSVRPDVSTRQHHARLLRMHVLHTNPLIKRRRQTHAHELCADSPALRRPSCSRRDA
jgi:hypothetical protein